MNNQTERLEAIAGCALNELEQAKDGESAELISKCSHCYIVINEALRSAIEVDNARLKARLIQAEIAAFGQNAEKFYGMLERLAQNSPTAS